MSEFREFLATHEVLIAVLCILLLTIVELPISPKRKP